MLPSSQMSEIDVLLSQVNVFLSKIDVMLSNCPPAQVVHHLVDDPQLGRAREHEGSEEVSGHAGHHLSHISYYVITEPIFHLSRLVHQ